MFVFEEEVLYQLVLTITPVPTKNVSSVTRFLVGKPYL